MAATSPACRSISDDNLLRVDGPAGRLALIQSALTVLHAMQQRPSGSAEP